MDLQTGFTEAKFSMFKLFQGQCAPFHLHEEVPEKLNTCIYSLQFSYTREKIYISFSPDVRNDDVSLPKRKQRP